MNPSPNLGQSRLSKCLCLLLLAVALDAGAQQIDPTFVSPKLYRASETWVTKKSPAGHVFLGGDIDFYGQTSQTNLVRITTTGLLDTKFKPNLSKNFLPSHIELLPNGNVLVASGTTIYVLSGNGKMRNSIAVAGSVAGLLALPDNRFLVSTWAGELFRFTKGGKLDTTFEKNGHFADGVIAAMALQGSQIIIGGFFTSVLGIEQHNLARINNDGTLDLSFNVGGSGTTDFIGGLFVQPDKKIIPYNTYINRYNDVDYFGGLRLNADGSVDTGFYYPFRFAAPMNVDYVNEKITFSLFFEIQRTNYDGSVDPDFTAIPQYEYPGMRAVVMGDNSLIVANHFKSRYGVAKFDASGNQVVSFAPPIGRDGIISSVHREGNNLVVGGEFFQAGNVITKNVARLSLTGQVDEALQVQENYGPIFQVEQLLDQSVLVSAHGNFFKVTSTGARDNSFVFQQFESLYQVEHFRTLDDGRIYAAGPNNVYRLNSDGTKDATYETGIGIQDVVTTLYGFDVDNEDRPIYGGMFTSYQGEPVGRLIRINTDGSRDGTFNIGTGANDHVAGIRVLKNEDIAVIGNFSEFNGTFIPNRGIVLSPEGELRQDFLSNFSGLSNAFLIDLHCFQDKLLITGYAPGPMARAFRLDGTQAQDFNFNNVVASFQDIPKFYSDDNENLYVMGRMYLNNGEAHSLIRINYPVIESAGSDPSVRASDDYKKSSDVTVYIYPNPVSNILSVELTDRATFNIYGFDGHSKLKGELNNGVNEINISNLKTGSYILTVHSCKKTNKIRFLKR